jgi:hypothetical protein
MLVHEVRRRRRQSVRLVFMAGKRWASYQAPPRALMRRTVVI